MTPNHWRTSLPATKVLDKIRELTLDMQAVQQDLCRELALPDGTPRKNRLPVELHATDDLGVLKTTVDQFRRVLWFYVEQTEQQLNAEEFKPPYSEQSQPKAAPLPASKLQRSAQGEAESQQPISFFDRLELVIEGYLRPSGPLASYRQKPKSQ